MVRWKSLWGSSSTIKYLLLCSVSSLTSSNLCGEPSHPMELGGWSMLDPSLCMNPELRCAPTSPMGFVAGGAFLPTLGAVLCKSLYALYQPDVHPAVGCHSLHVSGVTSCALVSLTNLWTASAAADTGKTAQKHKVIFVQTADFCPCLFCQRFQSLFCICADCCPPFLQISAETLLVLRKEGFGCPGVKSCWSSCFKSQHHLGSPCVSWGVSAVTNFAISGLYCLGRDDDERKMSTWKEQILIPGATQLFESCEVVGFGRWGNGLHHFHHILGCYGGDQYSDLTLLAGI